MRAKRRERADDLVEVQTDGTGAKTKPTSTGSAAKGYDAIQASLDRLEQIHGPSDGVAGASVHASKSPLQFRIKQLAADRKNIRSTGPGLRRLRNKRRWDAPDVPKLPGTPPTLALFDSASASVEKTRELTTTESTRTALDTAMMYVCGITPYDSTHIGHAATMVTFDLINRAWRDAKRPVKFVQNVTDIDDPLLKRANRDGVDWVDLAVRETERFRGDMEALRVIPPAHYIGAVEMIPSIVDHVTALLEAGVAYRMDDGTNDIYFDVSTADRFGYQSRVDPDEMQALFADRGGDPERAGKKHPLDALLWRGTRDGEPAWPGGELGPGRPGWHIECAVIAQSFLGPTVDVQGGGSDLAFPHHECSTAHAEALSGDDQFASHNVHAAMIQLDGEKMSKRKGNLVFLSELIAGGTDPMAVRLALLAGHYRSDRNWSDELLSTAEGRLDLWRRAASAATAPSGAELVERLRELLTNDLDTPSMLAAIDEWATAAIAGEGADKNGPSLMSNAIDALLGVKL